MYGLPITLTPQQSLACAAKRGPCGLSNSQLMFSMIVILGKIANMPTDCASLETYASQYACLPPQLMVPAMIYLLAQIQAQGILPSVINGLGPPNAAPNAATAIYIDTTETGQPNLWYWANGGPWSEFIGD